MLRNCQICNGLVDRYSPNRTHCSVQCLTDGRLQSRLTNAKGSNLHNYVNNSERCESRSKRVKTPKIA
jgi:hypothetical protein